MSIINRNALCMWRRDERDFFLFVFRVHLLSFQSMLAAAERHFCWAKHFAFHQRNTANRSIMSGGRDERLTIRLGAYVITQCRWPEANWRHREGEKKQLKNLRHCARRRLVFAFIKYMWQQQHVVNLLSELRKSFHFVAQLLSAN